MWRLTDFFKQRLEKRLQFLYGEKHKNRLLERIGLLAARYDFLREQCRYDKLWDEKSCLLITYGDMVRKKAERPFLTLHRFLQDYLKETIEWLHILPFFPYSSDDGFSVIDYRKVDPNLGEWEDIRKISQDFRLMVDLVLNHVSRCSSWFQDYIGGVAPAMDYFIEVDPETDLSQVVRPRTTPLLTAVQTVYGKRYVWTTFSSDQMDLNYANPDLLIEMLDILLFYISQGARIIRLDAVAYLWKKIGTSCVNLPETHEIVKLFRDIIDYLAPGVLLLTETNLPHEQNISYFGQGDEAHLIYQFSLPPLLLYTLHRGRARHLREWAAGLGPCRSDCTYLNFTASHDGIGVRPLECLIKEEEIEELIRTIRSLGGLVSSRSCSDSTEKAYELNITYFDALKDPKQPQDVDRQIERFICSQIIMLGLQGIPAIYFHSLMGTGNNYEGVQKTGQNRAINRARFQDEELRELLSDPKSVTARVFSTYTGLLKKRRSEPAFHPDASQEILDLPDEVFGFVRRPSKDGAGDVYCIHNVSAREQRICLSELDNGLKNVKMVNILNGAELEDEVILRPYQCCWLKALA
ncbi:sugar phosphorylase [Desulfovulcanus sp.]